MNIEFVEGTGEVPQILIKCKKIDQQMKRLKLHIELFDTKIRAKNEREIHYVELTQVLYFESVEDHTFLYTINEVLEMEQRLFEIEEMYADKDFIRTSKSQILNIAKVKSLRPQLNRTIEATMCNGEKLYISRKYVPIIKKLLQI